MAAEEIATLQMLLSDARNPQEMSVQGLMWAGSLFFFLSEDKNLFQSFFALVLWFGSCLSASRHNSVC